MGLLDVLGMKAVSEPITAAGDALDKLFTSDAERLAFEDKLRQYQQTVDLAQNETNKIEAQSPNWFVSGWRPALGWACAVSVAVNFIVQAVMTNYIWVKMCLHAHKILAYPDPHSLIELTCGILGIYGTQKTVEKIKGVS